MSKYIFNGSNVVVISDVTEINETLPPNTYTIGYNPEQGVSLNVAEDIEVNATLYGDLIEKRTERIINTFKNRNTNTGVLFSGIKGSGKSLQAKHTAYTIQKKYNIPVLVINSYVPAGNLSKFLDTISHEVCILVDEFEKLYPVRDGLQDNFLSLLDGLSRHKKLYLFTCNDIYDISPFMMARPGRIFYHFRYGGLTKDIINMYCQDKGVSSQNTDEILTVFEILGKEFTFDIMQSLLEEASRYNESPLSLINVINIKSNNRGARETYFKVHITDKTNPDKEIRSDEDGGVLWLSLRRLYSGRSFAISFTYEQEDKKKKPIKRASYATNEIVEDCESPNRLYDRIIISKADLISKEDDVFIFEKGKYRVVLELLEEEDEWSLLA